jgi:hypothetical protein
MWVLLIWIAALIIGLALASNALWIWRFLFWIEMRLPKEIDEL